MRIASTQYQTTIHSALDLASQQLSQLNQKMASGKRLLLPSDDPLLSVRLARLSSEEASIAQYRDNIGALKTRMQQSEALLSGMTTEMQQARDLLVGADDGSHTSADLAAMVTPLLALRDSLLYAANTKDQEGRYLFSGTASATPTITYDANAAVGSRYTFTGNTEQQNVVVSSGVTQPANVSVPDMAAYLNQLDTVADRLQTPGVTSNDPATRAIIDAALNGTDATLGTVAGTIGQLGGTQNILSALDTNHANVSLSNQQALIDLGQLDYGEAATQLTELTTALQATYKAYAKVSGLSLFNAI